MAHGGEKHLLIALCTSLFSRKKDLQEPVCQAQLSRVEAGPPEEDLRDLKRLTSSAHQLEIPALLLRVPRKNRRRTYHYIEIICGCVLG